MKIILKKNIEILIPVFFGIIVFICITNTNILIYDNINWMTDEDPAQHYLGWAFFRHSPWQFPPGLNPGWGLELSSAIVYTDSIPLFALFFKALSPILPDNFQYFGVWILICFIGQAIFSWKIFRHFQLGIGEAIIGTLILSLAPPMLDRLAVHTSLCAQFLILAGFYLYLTPRRPVCWLALLAVTALVHAYLLVMVLAIWAAAGIDDAVGRRVPWRRLVAEVGAVLLGLSAVLWLAGYFAIPSGPRDLTFGAYAFNLLGLIDPDGWSRLLPDLPDRPGDYEGFAYLGVGGLLLLVAALPALKLRSRPPLMAARPGAVLAILGLSGLAVSHSIGIGSYSYRIDVPDLMLAMGGLFRASGRLIWPVYYLLLLAAVIGAMQVWRGNRGLLLLVAALGLQGVDTSIGWQSYRQRMDRPPTAQWPNSLVADFWTQAASRYQKLRGLPPQNHPPFWRQGAEFAYRARLATDIGYYARFDQAAMDRLINQANAALLSGTYDADTLYLLDESAARAARASLTPDRDLLANIDGLYVLAPQWRACSTCPQPPLPSRAALYRPLPPNGELRFDHPTAAAYLAGGWYTPEPWGIWTQGKVARIELQTALPPRFRLHLDGHPFGPNLGQPILVRAGAQTLPVVFDSDKTQTRTLTFDAPGLAYGIEITLPAPASPAQLGLGPDARQMGLGLVRLRVEPLEP